MKYDTVQCWLVVLLNCLKTWLIQRHVTRHDSFNDDALSHVTRHETWLIQSCDMSRDMTHSMRHDSFSDRSRDMTRSMITRSVTWQPAHLCCTDAWGLYYIIKMFSKHPVGVLTSSAVHLSPKRHSPSLESLSAYCVVSSGSCGEQRHERDGFWVKLTVDVHTDICVGSTLDTLRVTNCVLDPQRILCVKSTHDTVYSIHRWCIRIYVLDPHKLLIESQTVCLIQTWYSINSAYDTMC